MTVRERLEQLKTSSVCRPSDSWKAATKEQLMRQVRNASPYALNQEVRLSFVHRAKAFVDTVVPESARGYVRPLAMASASFVFLIMTSLASVSASQNSVPGELLWQVKLAAEKTQVSMAKAIGDAESVARINLDSATKRVAEIEQLVAQDTVSEKTALLIAEVAIPALEESLKGTQESLEKVIASDTEKGVVLASLATEKMNEVHESLSDSLVSMASDEDATVSGTLKLTEKVSEATTLAQQVSLEAVSAVVENGSEDAAKAAVQTHIDTVVKDAETTQVLAEEVRRAVDAQTVSSVSSTVGDVLVSASSTASVVSTTVQALVNQSTASTASIEHVSVANTQTTTVTEVLEKAKDATVATIEAKTALLDLTKTISSVDVAVSTSTNKVPQAAAVSSTPVLSTSTEK